MLKFSKERMENGLYKCMETKKGQDKNGTISKAIRREVIITVGYADDCEIAPEF